MRVELEDNLYLSQGVQARSNAELVERAVQILHALDMDPAAPDEARRLIGLPPR
ncbi:3-keto-5-aminohexanoate cleavage protein [Pigmentiphaga sp. GD03639]|uniref:3-keto-5-aminohexanoate cleavage enzyme n=1 Tax=Pigmentiphaga daeguensis TaxID=414049 RepID=A0ABN1CEN9_9BURK|nr:3-keto-5-aminohexanoate cleavage protein [Pigmentiphaga sp. GD03639]MDH2236340.1 3-keto-5-aminohexanoate cleavage protein [Pigmentiphaga sp. GD03639]